ncbi:hypothetical protein B9Z07_25035 [Burkholderia cenocepacia]|uniref:Uncharacterized protein n=1 Tax=Burkholderia cenocepacia TaxID=95486 RepID=A0AAD0J5T6_9BURK|nr:hypothetical protein B9Z07_25035 [Burkholderia cenocepacia]
MRGGARFGRCATARRRHARRTRAPRPHARPCPAAALLPFSGGRHPPRQTPAPHLAFFAFCLVFLVTAFSQISA